MTTQTDAQFAARFPDMTVATFVANQADLSSYVPASSPLHTGMMADIGRAMVEGPDIQRSFFDRFMRAPLSRGDSLMKARFQEVSSGAYDPLSANTALFAGQRPNFDSVVASKNLSRQVAVEIHEYMLKQFAQTPEMIGDVMASLMGLSYACYRDDMWVASKEYFSNPAGTLAAGQQKIMTANPNEAGFADEMVETLWDFAENKFKYKSTAYNEAAYNTKADSVSIILKKEAEFPAFKKLLSETFNPEFLDIAATIDYVDDFATPSAGLPVGADEILGVVVDNRRWDITPMPEGLTVESFRNPSRKSTTYFTTYEYAFSNAPFYNCAYIYAHS